MFQLSPVNLIPSKNVQENYCGCHISESIVLERQLLIGEQIFRNMGQDVIRRSKDVVTCGHPAAEVSTDTRPPVSWSELISLDTTGQGCQHLLEGPVGSLLPSAQSSKWELCHSKKHVDSLQFREKHGCNNQTCCCFGVDRKKEKTWKSFGMSTFVCLLLSNPSADWTLSHTFYQVDR